MISGRTCPKNSEVLVTAVLHVFDEDIKSRRYSRKPISIKTRPTCSAERNSGGSGSGSGSSSCSGSGSGSARDRRRSARDRRRKALTERRRFLFIPENCGLWRSVGLISKGHNQLFSPTFCGVLGLGIPVGLILKGIQSSGSSVLSLEPSNLTISLSLLLSVAPLGACILYAKNYFLHTLCQPVVATRKSAIIELPWGESRRHFIIAVRRVATAFYNRCAACRDGIL